MPAETLFQIANMLVVPGWLVLLFMPRWKWGAPFLTSVLIPGLLAATYCVLTVLFLAEAEGGFGSVVAVRQLFQSDFVLVLGWIHYLAFDLFIGSWEVRDSARQGISHFFVAPCLVLTFLLGPIGLLLYLAIRWGRLGRAVLGD